MEEHTDIVVEKEGKNLTTNETENKEIDSNSAKYEYLHCPICGVEKKKEEKVCPKCGFNHVSIDVEGAKDIDIIKEEQEKRGILKIWTKKRKIITFALLIIIPLLSFLFAYFVYYGKYGVYWDPFEDDEYYFFVIAFCLPLYLIYGVGTFIYYDNCKGKLDRYIKERNNILQKIEVEEEKRKTKEEKERKAEAIQKEIQDYMDELQRLFDKYGEPDKVYRNTYSRKNTLDISKDIAVFGKSKHLLVNSEFIPFDQILGCNLSDNKRIVHGTELSKTQTNPLDALFTIGNAWVGDTAWATAWGTTARRETTTIIDDDIEVHDFTLFITINNLSKPVEQIHIGNSAEVAYELVGLINAIVRQNEKTGN